MPQGVIGSKARLFREGALCSATDYQFNLFNTSSQTATSTRDCGPGFYNSHGFVAVWPSGGNMSEYVTFPSDPLQYPAPAALAAPRADGDAARAQGTNPDGESYGTGEAAQADAELPDLVSAIGTDGELGYVRSDDLVGSVVDAAATPAPRTIPLLSQTGDPRSVSILIVASGLGASAAEARVRFSLKETVWLNTGAITRSRMTRVKYLKVCPRVDTYRSSPTVMGR